MFDPNDKTQFMRIMNALYEVIRQEQTGSLGLVDDILREHGVPPEKQVEVIILARSRVHIRTIMAVHDLDPKLGAKLLRVLDESIVRIGKDLGLVEPDSLPIMEFSKVGLDPGSEN